MLRFVIGTDNPSTIHYSNDLKGFSRVRNDIYYERYAYDSGNQIGIKIIAEVRNKATIKEDLLGFREVLKSAYNIDLKLKGYIQEERRQFSGLACDWCDIERIANNLENNILERIEG